MCLIPTIPKTSEIWDISTFLTQNNFFVNDSSFVKTMCNASLGFQNCCKLYFICITVIPYFLQGRTDFLAISPYLGIIYKSFTYSSLLVGMRYFQNSNRYELPITLRKRICITCVYSLIFSKWSAVTNITPDNNKPYQTDSLQQDQKQLLLLLLITTTTTTTTTSYTITPSQTNYSYTQQNSLHSQLYGQHQSYQMFPHYTNPSKRHSLQQRQQTRIRREIYLHLAQESIRHCGGAKKYSLLTRRR